MWPKQKNAYVKHEDIVSIILKTCWLDKCSYGDFGGNLDGRVFVYRDCLRISGRLRIVLRILKIVAKNGLKNDVFWSNIMDTDSVEEW